MSLALAFRASTQPPLGARRLSTNASPPSPSKAWQVLKTYLAPLARRAGDMLGSYREPIVYRFAVARALLKHVYVAERLSPPLRAEVWREAYGTLWRHAGRREWWRAAAANGELARVGVYALEAYGIFKIGEMVGRRSVVGYDLH